MRVSRVCPSTARPLTRTLERLERFLLCLLGACLAACSSPPAQSASGERIESITYEERFPLTTDVEEIAIKGERLSKVLPLLDRAQVTALSGTFVAAAPGVDTSTLVVTIHGASQRNRTIVVKNCAEPRVCSFFAAAFKSELVERVPVVCRDGARCMEP